MEPGEQGPCTGPSFKVVPTKLAYVPLSSRYSAMAHHVDSPLSRFDAFQTPPQSVHANTHASTVLCKFRMSPCLKSRIK